MTVGLPFNDGMYVSISPEIVGCGNSSITSCGLRLVQLRRAMKNVYLIESSVVWIGTDRRVCIISENSEKTSSKDI
jgi:hypothetical protein